MWAPCRCWGCPVAPAHPRSTASIGCCSGCWRECRPGRAGSCAWASAGWRRASPRRRGGGGRVAAQGGGEFPAAPLGPRVAALVLAAGQSRRMGTLNKLLIGIDGKPMVRHVAEAVQGSQARPIIVVTGHEREKVEAVLSGLGIASFVFNPDYAQGLSTSLKRGLAALPAGIDAAVVCLGDMPKVAATEIDRLIAAFNPVEGRALCVPTRHGKRGNPALLASRLFPGVSSLSRH